MSRTRNIAVIVAAVAWVWSVGAATASAAEANRSTRLHDWRQKNPAWRAMHLIGPQGEKLSVTKQLIAEVLAPRKFNVLILEVNYGFAYRSHPELGHRGLDKQQARELVELCRQHGVRLIPLFNCLGHQSWAQNTFALLAKNPQFDETPQVPKDNKGIYCREWCPSHPEVDKIVFDLLDELLDAFDADALHVGMDEVFLIGDEKCPRCRGKDKGELFAGVVNRLHRHLVGEKGVEMMMWGDRLLNAATFPYGEWEASKTGSHRAMDRIPKDIILCDWHYTRRPDYPSIRFFQQKGFRVLPATWKHPDGAVALIGCARKTATARMPGVLFTGWSAGGNGEHLLAAFRGREDTAGKVPPGKQQETGRQIAATIEAGLKAWDTGQPQGAAKPAVPYDTSQSSYVRILYQGPWGEKQGDTRAYRTRFGVDLIAGDHGMPLIVTVHPNSPAEQAGVQAYTVLRKINGQFVGSLEDVERLTASPASPATLKCEFLGGIDPNGESTEPPGPITIRSADGPEKP